MHSVYGNRVHYVPARQIEVYLLDRRGYTAPPDNIGMLGEDHQL